jgi:hypothetical protein
MRLRGVNYDVGRVLDGMNWRPAFEAAETRRELEIIRDDLHCNAVKLCGEDAGRLRAVAADALERGLDVWLSPELWDRTPADTLDYVVAAAREFEPLRQQWPDRVTLSLGTELTLFMRGITEGDTFQERLAHPGLWDTLRSGAHNAALNAFLAQAVNGVRQVFRGDISYASLMAERVDWTMFDIVAVDLYREASHRDWFLRARNSLFRHNKPVVITEFGCCTYRGAADAGGRGWQIVDLSVMPPELDGDYTRDEAEQARELTDLIATFATAEVDGAFVFTFVAPLLPYSENPRYDLDMASYSLVKSHGNRLGDVAALVQDTRWDTSPARSAYPDMPWDPKESFGAVADVYGRFSQRSGRESMP